MLSPCPPFHEDSLNERADITYASSCIHYKRSVQTSRVYGGCTTCWELVTWQSMILSFGNPNGPCWSWLTLLSIGIVYSHSPLVLLCNIHFGQHYMMNRYSHCLIRVFPGDEHVYKKIWFNEVSCYFQHPSGRIHANWVKPDYSWQQFLCHRITHVLENLLLSLCSNRIHSHRSKVHLDSLLL